MGSESRHIRLNILRDTLLPQTAFCVGSGVPDADITKYLLAFARKGSIADSQALLHVTTGLPSAAEFQANPV